MSVTLWEFKFRRANLAGARFEGCNLRYCDWTGANLARAEFSRSAIWDSTLVHANLTGANLRRVVLEGVELTGARYDRFTRWPAGFRPEEHGARLVE